MAIFISPDASQMHQILTNLIANAWEFITDNRGAIG
jgi:signal transduction histidine kinase